MKEKAMEVERLLLEKRGIEQAKTCGMPGLCGIDILAGRLTADMPDPAACALTRSRYAGWLGKRGLNQTLTIGPAEVPQNLGQYNKLFESLPVTPFTGAYMFVQALLARDQILASSKQDVMLTVMHPMCWCVGAVGPRGRLGLIFSRQAEYRLGLVLSRQADA